MTSRAPFSSDAQIAAIGTGLEHRTWPARDWTHDCHWAAALFLLARDGLSATQTALPALIRAYNEAAGGKNTATEGYHETITQASVLAAWDTLTRAPGAPLFETCNQICAGPMGRADWIETYWSRDTLFSPHARAKWIAPDRAPLPFRIAAP